MPREFKLRSLESLLEKKKKSEKKQSQTKSDFARSVFLKISTHCSTKQGNYHSAEAARVNQLKLPNYAETE